MRSSLARGLLVAFVLGGCVASQGSRMPATSSPEAGPPSETDRPRPRPPSFDSGADQRSSASTAGPTPTRGGTDVDVDANTASDAAPGTSGDAAASGNTDGPTATPRAPIGGLHLTGRALVAVPRASHEVFLTWRFLEQDAPDTAFAVMRSGAADGPWELLGSARTSTTFVDRAGPGTFFYRVVPDGGALAGRPSNVARVITSSKGRDWVEILPAMKGRNVQFADRHFADTDGDGELEFVTYYPRVPSYRGGVAPESYKLQVFSLFDPRAPRWTFDTGMGLQSEPYSSGNYRMDWDYEWTFKPVAWDIDGDERAEIITLAKRGGKYQYVVLRDLGDRYEILGTMDSPIPVGVHGRNNRHFQFFAKLGSKPGKPPYSFLLQDGTYGTWQMWAYDWNGNGFDLRWTVKSTAPGFKGNVSSSHTILVMDLDGDGRDEINNGATVLRPDGSVLWAANEFFGPDTHIDGQVIDDIDPMNPGLELMMHEEKSITPNAGNGNRYALFDARTGKTLWTKRAPGVHLQLNIAMHLTGQRGLDIVGTYGGHAPKGGFASSWSGKDLPYPFPAMPISGDRMGVLDWLGDGTRVAWLNFTSLYGRGGKEIYRVDLGDAPEGDVIPWDPDKLFHLWFNVDIVGDHREEIPIQMKDGSVRVYLNTAPLQHRQKTKWQYHSYQMMQAPGDYRYSIVAHP